MPTERRCEKCGAALVPFGTEALCPNCMLHEAIGLEVDPTVQPAAASPGEQRATVVATAVTEKPGDRIGRYKLLQQIGEGGMGVVYMAEQEEPIRRRVALKVIKLGMDTKSVIARFEAERQALALMDHPNIAKVLDAGATDSGRPFFVMELVRGIRITDYCDQNSLSTEERLKLFIQVCQAIEHAHQKGIIHRDIQPSNVLVTLHDEMAVPKIIDFGIAKAITDQRLTDKTLFTVLNQFIGTPLYMSPEQAAMSALDIDTRSDIYSLGVLLYELLTGKTPFDPHTLLKAGLDEMRRIIREQEPPRPSTRLSTLAEADLSVVAKHRHSESPKLIGLVRGDLDWIVMKSIEKDRTRRYKTASNLAEDLNRHLRRQPVLAAAPTIVYRVQKFSARHAKNLKHIAAAVVLAIIAAACALWTSSRDRSGAFHAFTIHVTSSNGAPVEGVYCRLIVGGYPSDEKGFPLHPTQESVLEERTDRRGTVRFRHGRFGEAQRNILYLNSTNYCDATRFLTRSDIAKGALTVILYQPQRVTLRYAFNPNGGLRLTGPDVISGKVTLYPMEGGSYRPPARAHFSFKQNKIVGGGGVLDVGIAIDQQNSTLQFGGSNASFDHCTDLGAIQFDSVDSVNTNNLVRAREDTPIREGHTYIYESNIYPPENRTQFTGFDVYYGKVYVESIEQISKAGSR